MFPKSQPALKANTLAFETIPLIKPTGFREYDARWLFEQEINLMGVQALGLGKAIAIDQVLVYPDGAVGLATAAEQVAQRKMQFYGFGIDTRRLDERLDRLVGLLVEQKIQSLEVGARQSARFQQQVFDVNACRNPAEAKKYRQDQQPPEVDFHALRRNRDRACGAD